MTGKKCEQITNRRLSDEEFFRIRNQEVLSQWETGKQLQDLDECIAAAKELTDTVSYARKVREAKEKDLHIMEPHFGRALTEYMIEGMNFIESESPLVPYGQFTIFSDSYTRKNRYELAQIGIERSRREGQTMLNGWPIVNFGVEEARRIKRSIKSGLTLNSTDEDGRLASEIALAAGWNACNCRSITECMSHCKEISLNDEIRINQYETRLAAIYQERGVPQAPHISCNLTGYDSCGFKSFIMVAQSLLGGEQGLKQVYLEFGLNMNLIQDTAMIRVTNRLCKEYCERLGYKDIYFTSAGMPFLGAWPARIEEADAMIAWNAVISMMSGCTTALLKCHDEAFATPTKEGMASAVRLGRQLDTLLGKQRVPECRELHEEEQMLELEVRTMMEKHLEAGDGDIAVGLCRGVDAGWITTMISPWKYNRGNIRLMRDADNAMRYFDTGDMPLPKEVKEYHMDKLQGRAKKEGRPLCFDMVVSDLQYASRLPLVRKD
jgi:methylaspartate mutase epsilon subunit